jgi:hypothetical protein
MLMRFRLLLLLAVAACAQAAAVATSSPSPDVGVSPLLEMPAATTVYATPITSDELRRDLMVFASDSFRGREAGTPDAVRAARYLADRAAAVGLEPAGDSGFFQKVPLTRQQFTPQSTVAVRSPGGARPLGIGAEIVPILDGPPESRMALTSVDVPLVFAAFGRPADFADITIDGRAVVIINGAPKSATAAERARMEADSAIGPRVQRAVQGGASAVIVILTGATEKLYDQVAGEMMGPVSLEDPNAAAAPAAPPRKGPMLFVARLRAGSPLLPAAWPGSEAAAAMPGVTFTAQLQMRNERIVGYNVAAIVRGTDSTKNRSYVAYGAHLDHIGIQPAVNGDSIANGADDDGSGSTTLLAIARSFKAQPARRSALFVWHTAEEKGLFGSEFFTAHPTVPIDSIVAQLNVDMVGRNAPDSLYFIGPMAAPGGQSRLLGRIVDSVNTASPRPFLINREWDSPTHPEHLYERSDHFNYAKRGIPIVFFTTGLHPDYHEVSDDVAKINFEKMARVGNLLFNAGQAVGNRLSRPK